MKLSIEKKVTFDYEDGETDPVVIFDETVSAGSKEGDTLLGMIEIGNQQQHAASEKSITVKVSEYIKSLLNTGG